MSDDDARLITEETLSKEMLASRLYCMDREGASQRYENLPLIYMGPAWSAGRHTPVSSVSRIGLT